jgi:hypothetical protein
MYIQGIPFLFRTTHPLNSLGPRILPMLMAAPGPRIGGEMCHIHDLWSELRRQITLFLRGVSLADVALGRHSGRAVGSPTARAADPEAGP